jgi:membrane fusion protein (multidrug efflux system)
MSTQTAEAAAACPLPSSDVEVEPAPRLRLIPIRFAIGAEALAALAMLLAAGAYYWTVGRFIQSTDDAYVQADASPIAPKISGYVARLLVNDKQAVKAGQPLAVIDDREMQAAFDEAKANASAAAATLADLDAEVVRWDLIVRRADAGESGAAQSEGAGLAQSAVASASARRWRAVLRMQSDLVRTQLVRAQADLRRARRNLNDATMAAPSDGTVSARTVRVGQYVQAGAPLMALAPPAHVYVVAQFREAQLAHLHAGQPARIAVDAYSGDDIVGRVDSVRSNLSPPDNVANSFTVIAQRIPVKIVIDARDALSGRLRPGMSVRVWIDTRDARR